jgi:hypothetical protein
MINNHDIKDGNADRDVTDDDDDDDSDDDDHHLMLRTNS